VRAILFVGLITCGLWIVQQDWVRTYSRWASTHRPTTPLGAWSRCFEPGARELYTWLAGQNDPNLVVFSNFHEFIALETKIPAVPIPPNREALEKWLSRISVSRGVTDLHVLYVLDPDNKWRSHWISAPMEIVREFGLVPVSSAPDNIRGYVFQPRDDLDVTVDRQTL